MVETLFKKKVAATETLNNFLADIFVRESELIRELLSKINGIDILWLN